MIELVAVLAIGNRLAVFLVAGVTRQFCLPVWRIMGVGFKFGTALGDVLGRAVAVGAVACVWCRNRIHDAVAKLTIGTVLVNLLVIALDRNFAEDLVFDHVDRDLANLVLLEGFFGNCFFLYNFLLCIEHDWRKVNANDQQDNNRPGGERNLFFHGITLTCLW